MSERHLKAIGLGVVGGVIMAALMYFVWPLIPGVTEASFWATAATMYGMGIVNGYLSARRQP